MDPQTFMRMLEARPEGGDAMDPAVLQATLSHFNGLTGMQGLNPLATINGINLGLPPEARARSSTAREQAALELKMVQLITSGQGPSLKPNSGKSVTVGDAHICVNYRDDAKTAVRIWEWHGHILVYDDEKGYTPEYIYGNYYQPTGLKDREGANEVKGVGLGGVIEAADKAMEKQDSILRRGVNKAAGK